MRLRVRMSLLVTVFNNIIISISFDVLIVRTQSWKNWARRIDRRRNRPRSIFRFAMPDLRAAMRLSSAPHTSSGASTIFYSIGQDQSTQFIESSSLVAQVTRGALRLLVTQYQQLQVTLSSAGIIRLLTCTTRA